MSTQYHRPLLRVAASVYPERFSSLSSRPQRPDFSAARPRSGGTVAHNSATPKSMRPNHRRSRGFFLRDPVAPAFRGGLLCLSGVVGQACRPDSRSHEARQCWANVKSKSVSERPQLGGTRTGIICTISARCLPSCESCLYRAPIAPPCRPYVPLNFELKPDKPLHHLLRAWHEACSPTKSGLPRRSLRALTP